MAKGGPLAIGADGSEDPWNAATRASGRDRAGTASSLSAIEPVERRTVQSRVYQQLRRALIEGQFDAGEVLRILDVAARLETSTMPVREALARLVAEQALEALPNRSVRVPLVSRERLEDVARARGLIEGEAVRLATPRLGAEDIAQLRQITRAYDETMVSGGDHAHRAAYNHAFHFVIYRAAGSKVLLPIIESLWLQSGPFIRASANIYDAADGLSATHHHWQIVEALERRDAEAAIEALRQDIGRAFDLLRARIETADDNRGEGQDAV
ncbi:GntR family transcriptional regulator [Mangrovibrevibacter kandeliae]|uniref:GntR family transcriptional regulator n=1 Tax=Mangrovibrevibacter kandeliae TaxID=2968473 RepID=UPI002117C559|nr:GntR family transcriptional regulator [Aurantimonas sp. CSK15Z-1]MCQ8782119.1 GntR family transcriptional regulator [Aurantimonas sp. CSK15Z-1]